jgi:hypothetical protein
VDLLADLGGSLVDGGHGGADDGRGAIGSGGGDGHGSRGSDGGSVGGGDGGAVGGGGEESPVRSGTASSGQESNQDLQKGEFSIQLRM